MMLCHTAPFQVGAAACWLTVLLQVQPFLTHLLVFLAPG